MSHVEHSENTPPAGLGPREATGLVRERLVSRLTDPDSFSVGWVVAPAGSGKSRLLAHVARAYPGPVAWCGTPDPVPRSESSLVAWIGGSLPTPTEPRTVDDLVDALGGGGQPILVVVDDAHLFDGSEAESALSALIAKSPSRLRLAMASRVNLDLDLSRLRVSGKLVEIGPDDLRFRTWEVEELFRDIYREPLLPEDVAALARRTAGWAAYLQLFFLATARKPQAERRRILASLLRRPRLVSEYLGRQVLADLSPELQDFLIRTSVLRRPSASLCDQLLGWSAGSAELLAELERRQLFTERLDEESYRYHTVLLAYLDAKLVETVGINPARDEHRKAGLLLEGEGWTDDALAAFAKAEDWEGVARILGQSAPASGGLGDAWIEALPPAVVETDSLLLEVRARRAVARGNLAEAVQVLRDAENVAVSTVVATRCRIERERIQAWLEPDRQPTDDWLGLLRRATQRQPVDAYREAVLLPGVTGRFAEGMAAVLAGDMRTAMRVLRGVASHPEASPAIAASSLLTLYLVGPSLNRPATAQETEQMREEVESSNIPWLNRLAQAAVLAGEMEDEAAFDDLIETCRREGDLWGEALISTMAGVGMAVRRMPWASETVERGARTFGELGAGVLEATSLAYAAIAALRNEGRDNAGRLANQARTLASLLDVPGAAGLAGLALALVLDDEREHRQAQQILDPLGLTEWPQTLAGQEVETGSPSADGLAAIPSANPADPPTVVLRCLGEFSLTISGSPVDETAAKPMERALLHLLCARANEAVHREALIEALWPDADPDAGLHRLQVAVSSLRKILGAAGPDGAGLLSREGDAYRLALPAGSDVDVAALEHALGRADRARGGNDVTAETQALREAIAAYRGPLLPGDGPAEWAVGTRTQLQGAVTDAAARLGALLLQDDQPQAAAETARAGLAVDRYRDDLWKVLIEGSERAGNYADAG
ncbi:MAG TPA: winged helix-turn-helix domain-containing protein, partial [Acidimicrobiales bacterium]